jgi:hypothetical protein
VKGALAGQQFTEPFAIFDGIQAFLDEIQRSELEHVFHHWIERVRWVLGNDEDYFNEETCHDDHSFQLWMVDQRPLLTDPMYNVYKRRAQMTIVGRG